MSKLYYELEGEGDPIVFIHGDTLDHRMWFPQVTEFAPTNTVMTYDMRGYGRSPIPEGPYTHHQDLYALLQTLSIRKAHLVGLSLGGEVAIDFILEYPDSVLSLTLLDSSLGGFKSSVDWDVHADVVGIKQAKQNWLNHPVFSSTRKNINANNFLENWIREYSGWHWLNADPRKKLNPSAKDRLAEINIPVITVVGANDLNYFHEISKYIVQEVKNVRKVVIRNVGHLSNLEHPQFINQLIRSNLT